MTYYSTQLATLLAGLLQSLMSDPYKLGFLLLAGGGQMMAYTGESLERLESSLAGTLVNSAATLSHAGG